eukprot:EG_transcript_28161
MGAVFESARNSTFFTTREPPSVKLFHHLIHLLNLGASASIATHAWHATAHAAHVGHAATALVQLGHDGHADAFQVLLAALVLVLGGLLVVLQPLDSFVHSVEGLLLVTSVDLTRHLLVAQGILDGICIVLQAILGVDAVTLLLIVLLKFLVFSIIQGTTGFEQW